MPSTNAPTFGLYHHWFNSFLIRHLPFLSRFSSLVETNLWFATHSLLTRLRTTFYLHEVEKDVVKGDIRMYLETSLVEIKAEHGRTLDTWPPQSGISALLDRSGTLFIYAATAIRYISLGGPLYKSHLSTIANPDIKSANKSQTSTIDGLYRHILDQACDSKAESEVIPMKQLVSMIIFFRNPLPIQAISSLSEIDAHLYHSPAL